MTLWPQLRSVQPWEKVLDVLDMIKISVLYCTVSPWPSTLSCPPPSSTSGAITHSSVVLPTMETHNLMADRRISSTTTPPRSPSLMVGCVWHWLQAGQIYEVFLARVAVLLSVGNQAHDKQCHKRVGPLRNENEKKMSLTLLKSIILSISFHYFIDIEIGFELTHFLTRT